MTASAVIKHFDIVDDLFSSSRSAVILPSKYLLNLETDLVQKKWTQNEERLRCSEEAFTWEKACPLDFENQLVWKKAA